MKLLAGILFCLIFVQFSIAQQQNANALFVMDIQENLVNPASKLHIDTSGINLFFENTNLVIEKFHSQNIPIFYIVNEWTNPFQN